MCVMLPKRHKLQLRILYEVKIVLELRCKTNTFSVKNNTRRRLKSCLNFIYFFRAFLEMRCGTAMRLVIVQILYASKTTRCPKY